MAIEVGQSPPEFTLTSSDGREVSLSDYSGKNVVVYFYPRDDTPGCTKQACGFRDLWAEIKATGSEVIGISPDDASSHAKFETKYQLPFTLLSDVDRKVMTEYGAYGEKYLYGRKIIGVIRSTVLIGKDGKVIRHWKRVTRAADHPRKVLEVILSNQ